MCGIPRPSSGHRIAIMFPSPSPSPSPSSSLSSSPSPSSPSSSPEPQPLPAQESYSLFFRESDLDTTKAVFRSKDISTMDSFRSCNGIDLRIERHGDLTISAPGLALGQIAPLYAFQLRPSSSSLSSSSSLEKKAEEMEFSLPQRLDLGVSEQGIVGRKVTVVARGEGGEVLQMGNGIVGYD